MRLLQGRLMEGTFLVSGLLLLTMAAQLPYTKLLGYVFGALFLLFGVMGFVTRLLAVSQFDAVMQMREAHREWRRGQVTDAYCWMDVALEHADAREFARVASNHELRFLAAYALHRGEAITTMLPDSKLFTLYNAVNERLGNEEN